jgi:hypothetical protein
MKKSAKATARVLHSRGARNARIIDERLEANKKRMTPETRRQLKLAKAELRRLTGTDEQVHPKGGPSGRYLKKEKAKSRRNPTQPHHAPNKPRR